MKRFFWTLVLFAMTALGCGTLYVAAQEFQTLKAESSPNASADSFRYQFADHVFAEGTSQGEILLRLDRVTGKTWRFHASQSYWTAIGESGQALEAGPKGEKRYELISHVYRNSYGSEQEMFVRVDAIDGRSWRYQGRASSWKEISVAPEPKQSQPTASSAAQDTKVAKESS